MCTTWKKSKLKYISILLKKKSDQQIFICGFHFSQKGQNVEFTQSVNLCKLVKISYKMIWDGLVIHNTFFIHIFDCKNWAGKREVFYTKREQKLGAFLHKKRAKN